MIEKDTIESLEQQLKDMDSGKIRGPRGSGPYPYLVRQEIKRRIKKMKKSNNSDTLNINVHDEIKTKDKFGS